ncbi:TRAP transporter small permease [Sedimentitalea todarodis]|uniref:TRAP transporter small permease protein n=1 Tax=Sedimentitalea todarodis TaxID=1631240 RepID=A0ABU3VN35_9RHOB|nr:TRAP transporter small permease [Sedimentitalea todarodis]
MTRVEALVAAVAYMIVTMLLLAGILARELFSFSIWGVEKMAVFAAIYAAFLGLALASASNSHLRPQFTDGWWPERWRPAVARLGDLLSALLFLWLGVLAARYVIDTHANDARSMVIYWPLWAIQIVIPYACFSSALRHLAFALEPALKPAPDIQG